MFMLTFVLLCCPCQTPVYMAGKFPKGFVAAIICISESKTTNYQKDQIGRAAFMDSLWQTAYSQQATTGVKKPAFEGTSWKYPLASPFHLWKVLWGKSVVCNPAINIRCNEEIRGISQETRRSTQITCYEQHMEQKIKRGHRCNIISLRITRRKTVCEQSVKPPICVLRGIYLRHFYTSSKWRHRFKSVRSSLSCATQFL